MVSMGILVHGHIDKYPRPANILSFTSCRVQFPHGRIIQSSLWVDAYRLEGFEVPLGKAAKECAANHKARRDWLGDA